MFAFLLGGLISDRNSFLLVPSASSTLGSISGGNKDEVPAFNGF